MRVEIVLIENGNFSSIIYEEGVVCVKRNEFWTTIFFDDTDDYEEPTIYNNAEIKSITITQKVFKK